MDGLFEEITMKKLMLILLPAALMLALTSCTVEVHWFDKSTYVPWYAVWVPAIAVLIIILAVAHKIIIGKKYKCPECGQIFSPGPFEISAWLHINDKRLMRCPKCRRRSFCKPYEE